MQGKTIYQITGELTRDLDFSSRTNIFHVLCGLRYQSSSAVPWRLSDEVVGFLLLLELFQLLVSQTLAHSARWFCTNMVKSFFKPTDPRKDNNSMDKYWRGYKG